MCPNCGAELKHRFSESIEPHGECLSEEWYECSRCREPYTEAELRAQERDEERSSVEMVLNVNVHCNTDKETEFNVGELSPGTHLLRVSGGLRDVDMFLSLEQVEHLAGVLERYLATRGAVVGSAHESH
jgi:hypothetical protein